MKGRAAAGENVRSLVVDLVRRKGNNLDEHTIREELEGNLCRCTGYHNIVRAIEAAAGA